MYIALVIYTLGFVCATLHVAYKAAQEAHKQYVATNGNQRSGLLGANVVWIGVIWWAYAWHNLCFSYYNYRWLQTGKNPNARPTIARPRGTITMSDTPSAPVKNAKGN